MEGHGSEVASALKMRLGGRRGFEAKQVLPLMQSLAELMQEANAGLLPAEERLTSENADDVRARTARDEAQADLETSVSKARTLATQVLGAAALREYGLAASPPGGAADLNRYVVNAVKLLRAHPRAVEDELVGTFSTDRIAEHLESGAKVAEQAGALLDREGRETQLAPTHRDAARATWGETYRGVATTLEGLYRLAGKPELADRIRRTARKAVGKDGPEDAGGGTVGTTPTEPAATPGDA